MPVKFTGWRVHHIAGGDLDGFAVVGLNESGTRDHVENLPIGVVVPIGPSPWGELDAQSIQGAVDLAEWTKPDLTGEVLGG